MVVEEEAKGMARILIAVDGSPPSQRALEYGASLASRLRMGVVLLHALPQATLPLGASPHALAEWQESLRGEGQRLLEALADHARSRGVRVETELLLGEPARTLVERAEAPDVELVVMGSRGQGTVARLLLGSVASQVVHLCTRPVVVVR
jgi:nucleotide-binding universal stress UspA family protein